MRQSRYCAYTKLKGKYRDNQKIGTFPYCTFLLEYGKLHNLIVQLPPISAASYIPKNKSDFEFEKLPSEKRLIPNDCNYVIAYTGKSNTIQEIFLKLDTIQIFKIKWQLKNYLVQCDKFKIGAILAILGFSGGRFYESQIASIQPKNPANNEYKKSDVQINDQYDLKYHQTDLKNDIITDSLKN